MEILGKDADVQWTVFNKSGLGSSVIYRGSEAGLATLRKVIEALDPKANFNLTTAKPRGGK